MCVCKESLLVACLIMYVYIFMSFAMIDGHMFGRTWDFVFQRVFNQRQLNNDVYCMCCTFTVYSVVNS